MCVCGGGGGTLQNQRVRATGPDQVLDTWALRNPIASEWLASLSGSRPDLDADVTLLSSTSYLRMRASQRSELPNELLDQRRPVWTGSPSGNCRCAVAARMALGCQRTF